MAGDKAIFVYFYQVISIVLTVRPDSVAAALLSYVSILFENHSNNSQNEWKWFVIGPLEKSSVTDTFSVSRMMMIAGLWMSEVCQHRGHSGSVLVIISGHCSLAQTGERRERLTRTGDTTHQSSDPARIKIGCWVWAQGLGWPPVASLSRAEELKMAVNSERGEEPPAWAGPDRAGAANPDQRGEREG